MTDTTSAIPYRVLARKYRPASFSGLIGQEALVRTLTNAIQSGRLAHAFVLTGVRGVGKTTTARIIARALNCVGADGKGGPTIEPCGVCEHCRAIAEDRHVDVLEMDAASRTGVNDIRELIDGVRYRPTSARFKIYIIDEVHMLSTAAFNALLKTLEEPPEHVKFIFATTEIRKIPVTVLSRCQRFDLRRVDMDVLQAHFSGIAEKEGASIEPAALALICRAADGSVRDGLSLLDQAIAHGAGQVSEAQVRDMLGLADRACVFDLFDAVMKGDVGTALGLMTGQYAVGADPVVILQDMLELTHWLTRLKLAPDMADAIGVSETERVRGGAMAKGLSMATLTRAWQMLLKGLGEVRGAPSPLQAAEMVLVRLAFAADLPSPAEALEALRQPGSSGGGGHAGGVSGGPAGGGHALATTTVTASVSGPAGGGSQPVMRVQSMSVVQVAEPQSQRLPAPAPEPQADDVPATFEALIVLLTEKREAVLSAALSSAVHLVHYEIGRIEFRPEPAAPPDLATRVSRLLGEWTGRPWLVSLSRDPGQATLREQSLEREIKRKQDAANHPLVQAVLSTFPGATIEAVRDLIEETAEADLAEPESANGEDE
ncbi:DNA polymerase III subunit gamma/tau [Telmatospirillum sp.]|uniref:DNA polymerase III subunit gamma/tau n=1 Tax=Telmatospirillum sp. TaxID=2079197 RepID=UPI00284A719F|nr:DNA polymerase III subunit gamma/tau [Telmatospirillum sp.]MDR3439187.1 DNA polymerase III subunit gamma/tau [Telmatospirillum sp.]